MRLGDVLAFLALTLYAMVQHLEYFPEWAQGLIALGWAVAAFYAFGGAR